MGNFITVFEMRTDEPFRTFSDGCCGTLRTIDACGDKYILEAVEETKTDSYRMYSQAFETMIKNNCKPGDIIQPFNQVVIKNGICPTITTRPEGLKTAILVVV